jgi:hypothetical protein
MKATTMERLWVRCPRHGKVRVVCPRCAGKAGGHAKRGRGRVQRLRALTEAERAILASLGAEERGARS